MTTHTPDNLLAALDRLSKMERPFWTSRPFGDTTIYEAKVACTGECPDVVIAERKEIETIRTGIAELTRERDQLRATVDALTAQQDAAEYCECGMQKERGRCPLEGDDEAVSAVTPCQYRKRCDCLGACKYGLASDGGALLDTIMPHVHLWVGSSCYTCGATR